MVSSTDLTSPSPNPVAENPYMMTAQAASIPQALLFNHSKDSRWLTLEVCREFQRNRCTRTEEECKFAHPPPHVDQQNGRVMCCFDSIKGKCQRKEPPCKYLHPPQHLKEQLLQTGRQNLAMNRSSDQARMFYNRYHWNQVLAQNQIHAAQLPAAQLIPGMGGMAGMAGVPGMAGHLALDGNRYLSAAAANAGVLHSGLTNQPLITTSPYNIYNQYPGIPGASPLATAPGIGQLPLQFAAVSQGAPASAAAAAAVAATLESQALAQIPSTSSASNATPSINGQKTPRADRLEVCSEFGKEGTCPVPDSECDKAHPPDYVLTEDDLAVVCMDFVKGKCTREHCKYYHPTPKLLAKVNQNRAALAAVNQANTHAAQQALSHVLAAAALHQAPVQTPQPLLGLGQGQAVNVAPAIPTAMPQVSQASINPYHMAAASYQPYPGALGMHAHPGLAGAYQTGLASQVAAGQFSAAAAGHAPGGLQAVAATSAASQDAVLSQQQQQAKKRPRDDELLLPMPTVPGMGGVPMKRQALDATKGGIPMFNPAAYQQLAYAQQQPAYVPVSFAGHPAGVQRL